MANPSPQLTDPIETVAEPNAPQAEEDRLLDEAEAEAERVGTIPFEEVEAWVRSWVRGGWRIAALQGARITARLLRCAGGPVASVAALSVVELSAAK